MLFGMGRDISILDGGYSWQRGKFSEVPSVFAHHVHQKAVNPLPSHIWCDVYCWEEGGGSDGYIKERSGWQNSVDIWLTNYWVFPYIEMTSIF